MDPETELTAAPAAPIVLAVLAEGEHDGYAILKRVRELSGGELDWADGMLYPLLHRLRRLGYVTADWRASEGHRRRYYTIAPSSHGPGAARRLPASARSAPGDERDRLLFASPRPLGACA